MLEACPTEAPRYLVTKSELQPSCISALTKVLSILKQVLAGCQKALKKSTKAGDNAGIQQGFKLLAHSRAQWEKSAETLLRRLTGVLRLAKPAPGVLSPSREVGQHLTQSDATSGQGKPSAARPAL